MSVIIFLLIAFFGIVLALACIGMSILSSLLGGLGNALRVARRILGMGDAPSRDAHAASPTSSSSSRSSASGDYGAENARPGCGKEFKRGEGEYVDFEEVR